MKKKTLLLLLGTVAVAVVVVVVLVLSLRKPHTPASVTSRPDESTQDSLVEQDDRGETTRVVTPQQTTPQGLPTTASAGAGTTTATNRYQPPAAQTTTGDGSTGGSATGAPTDKTNSSGLTEDQDPSGNKYGEIF